MYQARGWIIIAYLFFFFNLLMYGHSVISNNPIFSKCKILGCHHYHNYIRRAIQCLGNVSHIPYFILFMAMVLMIRLKGRGKVLSYLQSLNLQAVYLEAFCSSGEVDKMIEQCLNSALQTSQRKPYVNGPVDSL